MLTINPTNRKLEGLKGQMSLELFLTQIIGLKKFRQSSKNYLGLCPFHNDSHRSFGVNFEYPHRWGCLLPSCQKGSELATLVMKKKEISYDAAVELIETYMGYIKNIAESTLNLAYYEEEDVKVLSEEKLIEYSCGYSTHKYFYKRGLTEQTMRDFEVGFDRIRRRIVIPVYQDGELINFIGRTVDKEVEPKYLIYEDVDRDTFLFGEHMLPDELPYIVLYEGILETLMSHQIGEPKCLSLLGAYITKHHIERILRYTDVIVLFLDNDDAGKATEEKARRLIQEAGGRCHVVRHLSTDKSIKKDLLDYKSPKVAKMLIRIALNSLLTS